MGAQTTLSSPIIKEKDTIMKTVSIKKPILNQVPVSKGIVKENIERIEKEIGSPRSIINIDYIRVIKGSLPLDIRKVYKFKDIIGGGHFAQVRLAFRKDGDPNKYYAIKSIKLRNISNQSLIDLGREIEIISTLDHPNIIKFYETYHDQLFFHIVMELCTGKEIFNKLADEGRLTEHRVSIIIMQVLQSVAYLHSKGITHRDLKPENILFQSHFSNDQIKLIDFGLSRKYSKDEKLHSVLGTPYYVAPEVLQGDYDERCDIWSIGSIAYLMLSGKPAFKGSNNNEIFTKIINQPITFPQENWKNISKEALNFVKKCLVKDHTSRLNAKEAINHPWFSNIISESHKKIRYLNSDILENLKAFATPPKFKKIIFKFIAEQLSSTELMQLKTAFNAIDINHSGHIDSNELRTAFTEANITISNNEIASIISLADNDSYDHAKLTYTEFLIGTMNKDKNIDRDKLLQAFKYFDIDNDGYIDLLDLNNDFLRNGKEELTEGALETLLSEVNASKDKKISQDAFLLMFGIV